MSTTRVPPTWVFMVTIPGCSATTSPMMGERTVLGLLKDNLSDEKTTAHILSLAAELIWNRKAKRHESVKRSSEMGEFVKMATHGE